MRAICADLARIHVVTEDVAATGFMSFTWKNPVTTQPHHQNADLAHHRKSFPKTTQAVAEAPQLVPQIPPCMHPIVILASTRWLT